MDPAGAIPAKVAALQRRLDSIGGYREQWTKDANDGFVDDSITWNDDYGDELPELFDDLFGSIAKRKKTTREYASFDDEVVAALTAFETLTDPANLAAFPSTYQKSYAHCSKLIPLVVKRTGSGHFFNYLLENDATLARFFSKSKSKSKSSKKNGSAVLLLVRTLAGRLFIPEDETALAEMAAANRTIFLTMYLHGSIHAINEQEVARFDLDKDTRLHHFYFGSFGYGNLITSSSSDEHDKKLKIISESRKILDILGHDLSKANLRIVADHVSHILRTISLHRNGQEFEIAVKRLMARIANEAKWTDELLGYKADLKQPMLTDREKELLREKIRPLKDELRALSEDKKHLPALLRGQAVVDRQQTAATLCHLKSYTDGKRVRNKHYSMNFDSKEDTQRHGMGIYVMNAQSTIDRLTFIQEKGVVRVSLDELCRELTRLGFRNILLFDVSCNSIKKVSDKKFRLKDTTLSPIDTRQLVTDFRHSPEHQEMNSKEFRDDLHRHKLTRKNPPPPSPPPPRPSARSRRITAKSSSTKSRSRSKSKSA